jgi:glycosyltransferase involved in cell wall biosynthesis
VRVALSLLTLDPRIAGGTETYARALTRTLARGGAHEYVVLASRLAPDVGEGLPTVVATGWPGAGGTGGRVRALVGAALRSGGLAAPLESADVVHYPVTVPLPRTRRPRVVTLHDLQHRDLPQMVGGSRRVFRRVAYDRAAQRADRVIVISEWVRGRAIELLGLDPDRVHAIPLGVDLDRFSPPLPGTQREPFLLYPARTWPHKNHARLLEAFGLVRRERPELRLVLTGGGDPPTALPEGVEHRGPVPNAALADLYRSAAALVFPSLHEGFGLPPLEAMASGCPVAAARAGALPEVCGAAAVLFDPADPEAIASGVLDALARAAELVPAGLARAAAFTWERAAHAHDAVYALAADAS